MTKARPLRLGALVGKKGEAGRKTTPIVEGLPIQFLFSF